MEVFVYRINIIKYINGKLLKREGYIIFGYYNNLFKRLILFLKIIYG